jgi:hypothetical protein
MTTKTIEDYTDNEIISPLPQKKYKYTLMVCVNPTILGEQHVILLSLRMKKDIQSIVNMDLLHMTVPII